MYVSPSFCQGRGTYYADDIKKADDPEKARKDKLAAWKDDYASPVEAARLGEIDDVIVADELRQRICTAIEMMNA